MIPAVQSAPFAALTPAVSQDMIPSVTSSTLLNAPAFVDDQGVLYVTCLSCPARFPYKGKNRRYCSSPCRQAAYRRSSAHRACLDGAKNQRANRRLSWHRRKNAFKSLTFDGLHSGPDAVGVPPLGEINLKQFSKVRS
jgi:hypothetical protein